jgi:hypothetical protein
MLADCGIGTPVVTPSFVRAVPERSVTVSSTGEPRVAKAGVAKARVRSKVVFIVFIGLT